MSPVLGLFAPEARPVWPEETQGSQAAWSQGLQAITGLPHNKEISDSGPKVDDLVGVYCEDWQRPPF